jgi:hypothetical protein
LKKEKKKKKKTLELAFKFQSTPTTMVFFGCEILPK